MREQHHPLADSWRAGVTVFVGFCVGGGRRFDRRFDGQEKRRWRCRYGTAGSTTAGTGRSIPSPNPILGSRPVTGAGQAVAHRQACKPGRECYRKPSQPAWWHQQGCCAATGKAWACPQFGHLDLLFLPDSNQATIGKRSSAGGRYVAINAVGVNCG